MSFPATSTPRRLAQWVVVAFSGFLFVRTVCVEPFGVPTGSMAHTLFGNHREGFCPRCDTRVCVGVPPEGARPVPFHQVTCPNCGEPVDLSTAREIPGDRLLVDKTAFLARPPRRFEMAVFYCPADDHKPYVKRIIGLPGEHIRIQDGDVFANDRLLRKTLAQAQELAMPVFDLSHAPQEGWSARFLAESLAPGETTPPHVVTSQGLHLDGRANAGVGVSYRQRNLATQTEEPVTDTVSYNGPTDQTKFASSKTGEPVRDFLVKFTLKIDAQSGPGEFACRLSDGIESVRADFAIGPAKRGVTITADHEEVTVNNPEVTFEPGREYQVVFAFVDRRAMLAVEGQEVVVPLDLSVRARGAGGVARPVQFGVRGATVLVQQLKIARDVHYLAPAATSQWQLHAGEYFVLGDNAHDSHDSRAWDDARGNPAPGVPLGAFLGKPFLVHQPLRLARLPGGGVVPSPDWSRLRFLR